MEIAALVTAFFTLFVVIDPIGLTPMFIAITAGMTNAERRTIAFRGCIIAAGLLTLFALFGQSVLGFIGISMPAFRIAGGILLFLTALDMLFQRRTKRREGQAQTGVETDDPSVFPLATPLIAGPGSMATIILLVNQGSDWTHTAFILLMMALVIALALTLFLLAPVMERALGKTGIDVVTRLMGMLLAALSVQFVIDGLREIGVGVI